MANAWNVFIGCMVRQRNYGTILALSVMSLSTISSDVYKSGIKLNILSGRADGIFGSGQITLLHQPVSRSLWQELT
jgi:hypothetical protein